MSTTQIKYLVDGEVFVIDVPSTWGSVTEEKIRSHFHNYFMKFHGTSEIEIIRDQSINEGAKLLKG